MARKILLADDSVTAQNMGRKILADAGYEVITVNNGSAALKKIGEQRPDLIVLDVYMPGYSGLEVCQRLKEVGETARIPILLTVGKLEPFKTDEAKRVRADGFIVKPFEASELLSALSKLEDKIVPRAESSKPGRLARATAAIEEGRDRVVSGEEDSGWKSRISFPMRKKAKEKESAAEDDGNDPAIYNPVNKDLRTVVEHGSPQPAESGEARVDLGALAPEGLPKDVTPEEIAALAAAAAQVHGTVQEIKAEQQKEESAPLSSEPASQAVAPEVAPASSIAPEKTEEKVLAEVPKQDSHPTEEPAPVTSAISGSVPEVASQETSAGETWSQSVAEQPVTMAAAAAVGGGSSSRWTAVAVALAPEDEGLSLEQEMQKAYAEFAAAQSATAVPAPAATTREPEIAALSTPPAEPKAEEAAPVSDVVPVLATIAPEPPMTGVVQAASETFSAAVKDFESVAAAYIPGKSDEAQEPSAAVSEPLIASQSEVTTEPASAPAVEEAIVPVPDQAAPETTVRAQAEETQNVEAPQISEPSQPEPEQTSVASSAAPASTTEAEIPALQDAETPTPSAETSADQDSTVKPGPAIESKDSDIAATTAAAWASWRKIRESGDSSHPAPSETDKSPEDAAMAVAAGAEKSPEDTRELESDPAIASIVDSVLADLRPKIVEEISRKLGKKK